MNKTQILYILNNKGTNEYKIGITNDLNRRLAQLQTGCPNELIVTKLWTHYSRKAIEKYERVLHRYFTKCGCRIRRTPDIYQLCKPETIAEQNEITNNLLKMM